LRAEKHHVAAIYLQDYESSFQKDDLAFRIDILSSIANQLTGQSLLKDAPKLLVSDSMTLDDQLEALQNWIVKFVAICKPTFLIVDDLDRCGYRKAQLLETEVSYFQKHGLRIMITSCVAPPRMWSRTACDWVCDVKNCPIPERNVWICETCANDVENSKDKWERFSRMANVLIVCTSCIQSGNTIVKTCNW
jgi:hypothetical protein